MESKRRLAIIWHLLRPIAHLVVRLRFHYHVKPISLNSPSIVVCNHVTDWDPILVGVGFKNQLRFVSSEHILRLGWISRLLEWLVAPIPRQKGGSAAGAVKAMLRVIKDGGNVAFFPEGNRTWDGITQRFPEATGKLARTSGASLVTFKLTGGYFASPRWSGNSCRKGKMTGAVVRIYTPEELRAMTVSQINEVIYRDLYEDAYARQAKHPQPFRGKNLAEHLETLLYKCPKCGSLHCLESHDDRFRCKVCGASARFALTGRFAENGFPFENVAEWYHWQLDELQDYCQAAKENAIFTDSGFALYRVHAAKSSELIAQGELSLYKDRLDLPGDVTIPLSDLSGMSLRGASDLYIGTANGSNFVLKASHISNTKKYLDACIALGCPIEYGV